VVLAAIAVQRVVLVPTAEIFAGGIAVERIRAGEREGKLVTRGRQDKGECVECEPGDVFVERRTVPAGPLQGRDHAAGHESAGQDERAERLGQRAVRVDDGYLPGVGDVGRRDDAVPIGRRGARGFKVSVNGHALFSPRLNWRLCYVISISS
jgi:hypothetical protein